jgi:transcription elongation factor Elf1
MIATLKNLWKAYANSRKTYVPSYTDCPVCGANLAKTTYKSVNYDDHSGVLLCTICFDKLPLYANRISILIRLMHRGWDKEAASAAATAILPRR